MFTAISLFSGAVDGLAIAAQAAGFNVTHHVEWDAWCCRVLRMNHPDSIVLNKDINDVTGLPTTSIIFGGSPCQGWSAAGNQKGFSDPRYLWPQMFRIIQECRPDAVIHENVRGGVSEGLLDEICGNLESEGYSTKALVFPACVFGAPHERYRFFVIGLMGNSTGKGLEGRNGQKSPLNECPGSSENVVKPTSNNHENIGTGANAPQFIIEPIGSNREGGANPIDDRAQLRQLSNEERSLSQSTVGMSLDGFTSRIPRPVPVTDFLGFPAGQGFYQHPYEPPRTIAKKGNYHKEQIRALGNAVVWQQAAPIFRAVVRWLQEN